MAGNKHEIDVQSCFDCVSHTSFHFSFPSLSLLMMKIFVISRRMLTCPNIIGTNPTHTNLPLHVYLYFISVFPLTRTHHTLSLRFIIRLQGALLVLLVEFRTPYYHTTILLQYAYSVQYALIAYAWNIYLFKSLFPRFPVMRRFIETFQKTLNTVHSAYCKNSKSSLVLYYPEHNIQYAYILYACNIDLFKTVFY